LTFFATFRFFFLPGLTNNNGPGFRRLALNAWTRGRFMNRPFRPRKTLRRIM
jgi:hypothetical protein